MEQSSKYGLVEALEKAEQSRKAAGEFVVSIPYTLMTQPRELKLNGEFYLSGDQIYARFPALSIRASSAKDDPDMAQFKALARLLMALARMLQRRLDADDFNGLLVRENEHLRLQLMDYARSEEFQAPPVLRKSADQIPVFKEEFELSEDGLSFGYALKRISPVSNVAHIEGSLIEQKAKIDGEIECAEESSRLHIKKGGVGSPFTQEDFSVASGSKLAAAGT